MKKIVKYSSLWSFFWLQVYLFFQQFNTLLGKDLFTVYYQIASGIYITIFISYVIFFILRKLTVQRQYIYECIILVLMMGLSAVYGYYIFSNPWIFGDEADVTTIIIEIMPVVLLIGTTLISSVLMLSKEDVLVSQDPKMWNTYDAFDGLFLTTLTIGLVILFFFNSKLIDGIRREYFQLARIAFSITGIGLLWSVSRYFITHRIFFYTAVTGFYVMFLQEVAIFFIFVRPSNILLLDTVTTKISVSTILYICLSAIIFAWLCWSVKNEKKNKK